MSRLLSVNHLTKIYGCGPREVRALWDVNFALEEGSFTAVLGEAGSGKSALLDILGGLEAPTHGRYQFRGEEVTRMGECCLARLRGEMGFALQWALLEKGASLLEDVSHPLMSRGIPTSRRREMALRALAKVGLEGRASSLPDSLNDSQLRRAVIARAIAAEPSLLLVEEPGESHTDAHTDVGAVLRQLGREGLSIVLFTRDQQLAACAPRQLLLQGGRLVGDIATPPQRGTRLA